AAGGCCSGNRCVALGASCPTGGLCMPGAACGNCGAAGKLCCPGQSSGGAAADFCTAPGNACRPSDDKCQQCGKKDGPCRDRNRCDEGGCCDWGRLKCVAAGSPCADNSICTAGGCSSGACGRIGEPRCAGTIGCTAPWAAPGPDGNCTA